MALMDAYGLSLMKVEEWGLLWAVISCAFILSGVVIARTGLGANPVRTLLLVNLGAWVVAVFFTIRSEEHTSELQSLLRISSAVFCLQKKYNNLTQLIYK